MKHIRIMAVIMAMMLGQMMCAQVLLRVYTKDNQKFTYEKDEVKGMILKKDGTGKNDVTIAMTDFKTKHATGVFTGNVNIGEAKYINYNNNGYKVGGVVCDPVSPYPIRTEDSRYRTGMLQNGTFNAKIEYLQYNKVYYFRPWFEKDLRTYYGKAVKIRTPEIERPEMVDLGLSVKWADRDMGQYMTSSLEFGLLYDWGELEHRLDGSGGWENYVHCDGNKTKLTKYNTDSSLGTVDGKTVLDLADDVANVSYGGTMRIPTIAEFKELFEKCKVISNKFSIVLEGPNGNRITLNKMNYWVNSLSDTDCTKAKQVSTIFNNITVSDEERALGAYIRPVCD